MRRCSAILAMTLLVTAGRAQTPLLEPPARLGAARPADEPVKPASFQVPGESVRIVPDAVAEKTPQPAAAAPSWSRHAVSEFVNSKSLLKNDSPPKDRRSDKLGDGIADLFDPHKPKEWLFSDHGFDCIATPISNPFLAEDPRSLTEVRPIFIYQKVPGEQPNFQGGNIWFFGARASIALTERFSLTLNKLGGIYVDPDAAGATSDFGFAEVWLGPKYAFYRDTHAGTIASAGLMFQIPTSSSVTMQDTGSLSLVPYVSAGQTLWELSAGTVNGIADAGYSFATDGNRSDYFYMHGHLDFDVGDKHCFYPILELNWFQYGAGGDRYFSGQGHDLINTGAIDSNNATLFTIAMGARYKISEASQIGGAFELPLLGNRDLFQYRFTIDFIFRY